MYSEAWVFSWSGWYLHALRACCKGDSACAQRQCWGMCVSRQKVCIYKSTNPAQIKPVSDHWQQLEIIESCFPIWECKLPWRWFSDTHLKQKASWTLRLGNSKILLRAEDKSPKPSFFPQIAGHLSAVFPKPLRCKPCMWGLASLSRQQTVKGCEIFWEVSEGSETLTSGSCLGFVLTYGISLQYKDFFFPQLCLGAPRSWLCPRHVRPPGSFDGYSWQR